MCALMLTMPYSAISYADYLLTLGSGELSLNTMEKIEWPQNSISNNNVIDTVFDKCFARENHEGMKRRAKI